jgi:long-chain acyl-CoA synthetase
MLVSSENWQLVQHACSMISTIIATAYDTLGESGLNHALNEPECVGMFTNANLLPTLLKVLPDVSTVKLVIYDGTANISVVDRIRTLGEGIRVISLDEVKAMGKGKDENAIKDRLPTRDDVSCIMYTSGSTGKFLRHPERIFG